MPVLQAVGLGPGPSLLTLEKHRHLLLPRHSGFTGTRGDLDIWIFEKPPTPPPPPRPPGDPNMLRLPGAWRLPPQLISRPRSHRKAAWLYDHGHPSLLSSQEVYNSLEGQAGQSNAEFYWAPGIPPSWSQTHPGLPTPLGSHSLAPLPQAWDSGSPPPSPPLPRPSLPGLSLLLCISPSRF